MPSAVLEPGIARQGLEASMIRPEGVAGSVPTLCIWPSVLRRACDMLAASWLKILETACVSEDCRTWRPRCLERSAPGETRLFVVQPRQNGQRPSRPCCLPISNSLFVQGRALNSGLGEQRSLVASLGAACIIRVPASERKCVLPSAPQ